MDLVRLLTLWPPFEATQFILVPEVPSHYHTITGPSEELYVLTGPSEELYVLKGCDQ